MVDGSGSMDMGKGRIVLLAIAALVQVGCSKVHRPDTMRFATAADYPPFGYVERGEIVGFEIDLARQVARELGKEAIFQDLSFAAVLPALGSGRVDTAVATITATDERSKTYDFSNPYFHEELFSIFPIRRPLTTIPSLAGKRLACQLGSTMELWLRSHENAAHIVAMDSVGQIMEAVKAGQVDGAILDGFQAKEICSRGDGLGCSFLARSSSGYAMAFRKNSPLRPRVNEILRSMEADGTLGELRQRWGLDGRP
ncbi:MAG: ABC transporter substrate-binding protein [Puniceicoccales bacterium]|nr:ABC transporter substrate-binding protein [Puniceicoccales bacterium]